MSQGECDPCGVDVFLVRFPGALPPAIHIHPLRGCFSLALYIICENGLVAKLTGALHDAGERLGSAEAAGAVHVVVRDHAHRVRSNAVSDDAIPFELL